MNNAVRYQVMPPLASDEYQELYEDIKVNGIHTPIHVDEEGVIIDGHHRSQIAKELGIPCPVITHDDLDEAGKRALAFSSNLKRRHLSREKRQALIAESLRLNPLKRDQEHARQMGIDPKTVKRIRADEGIPTPDDVIREYVEEHPEKSNREVAADLGVSHPTVAEIRGGKKRDIPENYHPAPASQPERNPAPEPEPSAQVGPNEEIPTTSIIGTADLAELNAQTPTPEPEAKAEPQKPRRTPITDEVWDAILGIKKAVAKLSETMSDDRFGKNKAQIAELASNDLDLIIESLTEYRDNLK